jgi:hypothetical protein
LAHSFADESKATMGKRVVSVAFSSLLLLVLSANLNAFTLASLPAVHPHWTRQGFNQNILNNVNRDNREQSSDFTTCLTTLRSGGDAGMEGSEPSILSKAHKFVNNNFFLVGMFVAVALAKLIPSVSKKTAMAMEEIRCKLNNVWH